MDSNVSYATGRGDPRLSQFLGGVRAEIPIAFGVLPFGIIYGVIALAAGLTPAQAQAMSVIVFAGSAQFIGAELMGLGTPISILWLTTFVVNVRHMLYSVALGPELQHLSRPWRWLLAYLLTDEAYVVTAVHYDDPKSPRLHRHWYMLGAGLMLWVTWQSSTAVGVYLGTEIPASWGLDFALALTFIGIVVPLLNRRPMIAAAVTAGVIAVVTFSLPYNLGLVLATLAGIGVGVWLERLQHDIPPREDTV